ncbi:MAG TPA: PilZ domain-containing protein [Bryobacteraceae bacterium]|nr:PilZ domain-containing protein [Bryobacteraceae bacterium]
MGLFNSVKDSLQGVGNRRRAPRLTDPRVLSYYWNGAQPVPHRLRDVSRNGAYIYAAERWYLGTILQLTLEADTKGQTAEAPSDPAPSVDPASSVTLWAKVIRYGADGIGVEFMFPKVGQKKQLEALLMEASVQPGEIKNE